MSDTQPEFPIACQRVEIDPGFCAQDVHGWFSLSYSSYLVLTRSLLQEMPPAWQHEFVRLIERLHEEFPEAHGDFRVNAIDGKGRFVSDPLRNYRYPDQRAIEEARGEPLHSEETVVKVELIGECGRCLCRGPVFEPCACCAATDALAKPSLAPEPTE